VDIDYDLLAQKIKELTNDKPKKLTGQAFWRARRRERYQLTENYIAPESGAPLITPGEYETMMKLGVNWSIKEREAIKITLANIQRLNKGDK